MVTIQGDKLVPMRFSDIIDPTTGGYECDTPT